MSSRHRRRHRRGLLLSLVAALLALWLAGCGIGSAGSGADESSDAGGASVADEPAGVVDAKGLGGSEAASAAPEADREIITTGDAALVAPDPAAAAQKLARLVEQAGGRVEQRDERTATADSPGSASLTVRLPANRMTSTVDALASIGEVSDVSLETVDVTGQGRDLDARIAALATSTARLRDLMAAAGSTKDLLVVEKELSDRQADLDALRAQREQLSEQVAMSTLHVEITSEPVTVAQSRGGFLGGLESGWKALVATIQAVVLVVGVLLPWLALVALGYLVFRAARRRMQTPPSAPSGPAPSGPAPGGPASGGHAPDDAPVAPEPEPVGR